MRPQGYYARYRHLFVKRRSFALCSAVLMILPIGIGCNPNKGFELLCKCLAAFKAGIFSYLFQGCIGHDQKSFGIADLMGENKFRKTDAQEILYQALALARLHSLQALYTAFPDAVLIARKEDTSCTDTTLEYTAVYTLEADICTQNDPGS